MRGRGRGKRASGKKPPRKATQKTASDSDDLVDNGAGDESDPEIEDKTIVCVDHVDGTPVIGRKNLKTGTFTACSNFSIEILRFADGVNFSAPSYVVLVYITSIPGPRRVIIPDNVEHKKQLTKAITSALSAPTYCMLTSKEFELYYGDVVATFVRKGLPKAFLISYTGIQTEGLNILDLPGTFYCVLSDEIVLGYDGKLVTEHDFIVSPDIVNKYNRKKDNKLNMLNPVKLEPVSLEVSKKQFEKLFDVGPEGDGAESFKLLLASYQAQLAAPVVKQVKHLDNTPLVCMLGEHGATKTTSNVVCLWAFSDLQHQFSASTAPATLELLSTTTNFSLYLDDMNNLEKEEKLTAPFYDEKGIATQTGGMSKPRAKLVWSTNEMGGRNRKVGGRSAQFRLKSWLHNLDTAARTAKLTALKSLLSDERRPIQFTISLCQIAATQEFTDIYTEQLEFIDQNFPPGLDSRERNLWSQLLSWFEVFAKVWPDYFDRMKFRDYLRRVVVPDIQIWNPSAGPSSTLDEFLCAGIEKLMKDETMYYKLLRSVRLGRKGRLYISHPCFPHVEGTGIKSFANYVPKIGGNPNSTQKFLRIDSIDTSLIVSKSNPGWNAGTHKCVDLPVSSLKPRTISIIEAALKGFEAWKEFKTLLLESDDSNEESTPETSPEASEAVQPKRDLEAVITNLTDKFRRMDSFEQPEANNEDKQNLGATVDLEDDPAAGIEIAGSSRDREDLDSFAGSSRDRDLDIEATTRRKPSKNGKAVSNKAKAVIEARGGLVKESGKKRVGGNVPKVLKPPEEVPRKGEKERRKTEGEAEAQDDMENKNDGGVEAMVCEEEKDVAKPASKECNLLSKRKAPASKTTNSKAKRSAHRRSLTTGGIEGPQMENNKGNLGRQRSMSTDENLTTNRAPRRSVRNRE